MSFISRPKVISGGLVTSAKGTFRDRHDLDRHLAITEEKKRLLTSKLGKAAPFRTEI